MKLYLIVASGKQQGKPIRIDTELFMIGSDPMCQMRTKVEGVGRRHCLLTFRDHRAFVRDLGGGDTVVNGETLHPGAEWPLHAGDLLTVGPLQFLVQFTEAVLSKRDLEEWALKCLDRHEEGRPPTEDLVLMQRHQQAVNASKAAEAVIDRLAAERGLVIGRLRIGVEEGLAVVRINDMELLDDAELAVVEKEIHKTLDLPCLRVLMDFKNVRRCSVRALQMIGELNTWLKGWGSVLAVCRLHPEFRRVLLALPALKGVLVFEDKAAALAAEW
jgi:hypothetical protein